MALDGCGVVCKYILIIFNIIFSLVGFTFLGLGMWLRFSGSTRLIFEIEELNASAFVIGVTVLIILGFVMLIVGVFGDGACSEKSCALQVFSVLLSCLVVVDMVVGILAYVNNDTVVNRLVEFYASMYTLYVSSGDPAMAVTLTFIHKMLQCCGMTGVSLIEIVQHTCPAPKGFVEHIIMKTCQTAITEVFGRRAVLGIFVGTGILLITALVCATILLKQIKRVNEHITTHYSTVY